MLTEPAINICQVLDTSGDALISMRCESTDPTAHAAAATINAAHASAFALVSDWPRMLRLVKSANPAKPVKVPTHPILLMLVPPGNAASSTATKRGMDEMNKAV